VPAALALQRARLQLAQQLLRAVAVPCTKYAVVAPICSGPGGEHDQQLALILSATLATAAMAEGPTCNGAAAQKKLAGAAKTSFMRRSEQDAEATCEASSKENNLSGAAKKSFEAKCVKEAVGESKKAG
jgi:hypothetical protein